MYHASILYVNFSALHQSNHLLQSILFDLKNVLFIADLAGMRAIAVLSKLFMAPVWGVVEDKLLLLLLFAPVVG